MMRVARLLAAVLALLAAASAPGGARDEAGDSCADGERRLYAIVFGGAVQGIQVYCGDRTTPVRLISLADGRAPRAIDHDRSGDLFVPWESVRRLESGLSIFAPSGAPLADRPEPTASMLVERNRSTAYLVYVRRDGDTTETVGGHAVHFAQFQTFFRSVGIDGDGPDITLPEMGVTQIPPVLDAAGNVLVDGYRDPSGLIAILDPQKGALIGSLFAPACAVASGADGLVYAVNCLGELRVFDPAGYRLIGDRRLHIATASGPERVEPNRIAVDRDGTVFVSCYACGTLIRFERGATEPSAMATDAPHVADLQLDAAGNVYALEGGSSAASSSIRVFDGRTLTRLRTYDPGPALSVYGMTIVEP